MKLKLMIGMSILALGVIVSHALAASSTPIAVPPIVGVVPVSNATFVLQGSSPNLQGSVITLQGTGVLPTLPISIH